MIPDSEDGRESDSSAEATELEGEASDIEDESMDSDSSEEWAEVGEGEESAGEEEDEEGEDEMGGAENLEPMASGSTLGHIHPTLRAAHSTILALERRLFGLRKTSSSSTSKTRTDRLIRQLDAERFITSRYRQVARKQQLQLVAAVEGRREAEKRLHTAGLARWRSEKKLGEAMQELAQVKAAGERQREESMTERVAARGQHEAEVARAVRAEERQASAEKRVAQLEAEALAMRKGSSAERAELDRVRGGLAEAVWRTGQTREEVTRVAAQRNAAQQEAQDATAALAWARKATTDVETLLGQEEAAWTVSDQRLATLTQTTARTIQQLEHQLREAEQRRDDSRIPDNKACRLLMRSNQQVHDSREESERRRKEAEEGKKEAERQGEQWKATCETAQAAKEEAVQRLRAMEEGEAEAERKLDLMREAHELEREMYVERLRALTGRTGVKVERGD